MTDLKAGTDADPRGDTQAQLVALDAIARRRAEQAAEDAMRGELAFARCVAAAPGLMVEMEKLRGRG